MPRLDEINPYASPAVLPAFEQDDEGAVHVRREGFHLVIEKGSRMPPICIKTGLPAKFWVRCPLSIRTGDGQLHALAEAIPGLRLLFRFLNQMEFLEVGLSAGVYQKRRRLLWGGALLILISVAGTLILLSGFWLTDLPREMQEPLAVGVICIGPFMACVGVAMISQTRLLYVKRVTPTEIWFTGALPNVLEMFPGSARPTLILPDDWPFFADIGIWHSGKHLVMRKDAIFPAVCLQTGEPAQRTIRVRHSYVGHQQRLSLGISTALYATWRRNRWGLLGGLACCLCGSLLAGICFLVDETAASSGEFFNPALEVGAGAGMFLLLGGMMVALVYWCKPRILTVKKVEPDRVWLSGFSQQVLAMFPELPLSNPRREIP